MFLLKLSITTGWTMEQIESMPDSLIRDYITLNSIKPFLYEAQAYREGLLTSIIYNQNVEKKDRKNMYEIFPYLKDGLPEWLEDKMISNTEEYINSLRVHLDFGSKDSYYSSIEEVNRLLVEQLEMEKQEAVIDKYRINEISRLLNKVNKIIEDRK